MLLSVVVHFGASNVTSRHRPCHTAGESRPYAEAAAHTCTAHADAVVASPSLSAAHPRLIRSMLFF